MKTKTNKQFNAFTLAEVLITLGIMGVVAALTIPALIQNKAKQETVAKLQKAYTSIAQAVKLSEIDNGPSQNWDWGTNGDVTSIRQSFDTLWSPYLKIMKYCNTPSDCGYNNGTLLTGMLKDGVIQATPVDSDTRTAVLLPDGTFVMIHTNKHIWVDINGKKSPNMYGKDVFIFNFDPSKGLVPWGVDTNATDCKSGGQGQLCAAKIIRDGWQIKDDYPW